MIENCSLAIVDNTDPDNLACVLALANAQVKHSFQGVIVTGRAANFDRNASIESREWYDSEVFLRINAVRMRNFLNNAGHSNVPVYMGSIAPYTLIPHKVHIDERDIGDLTLQQLKRIEDFVPWYALGLKGPSRDIVDAVNSHNMTIDIIVGGPMTDLARLSRQFPEFAGRIRSIHAQFGSFGFGEKGLMEFGDKPRGKRQFNVACDPVAAHEVLMNLNVPVYLYPSDITRVDAIGFSNPDELASQLDDTPAARELIRIYRIAYEKMVKPRGEKIYIHDLAPAFGYLDMYPFAQDEIEDRGARAQKSLYHMKPVEVIYVPHLESEKDSWGEIEIDFMGRSSRLPRYVATGVDPARYLKELRRLVR